jgi:hypothetical protein
MDLRQLVGELSTLSNEFRTRWAAHPMGRPQRPDPPHRKQAVQPPDVGLLDLIYHSLDLAADDALILDLTIYTAEPGTPPKTDSHSSPAGLQPTARMEPSGKRRLSRLRMIVIRQRSLAPRLLAAVGQRLRYEAASAWALD